MIIFAIDCVAVNKTVVNKDTILEKTITLITGSNGITNSLTTSNNENVK